MRISTSQMFTTANRNMADNQTSLLDIQSKLSSGKQFTSLAENPVGASQVVSLKRELAQLDMYQSNIDASRRRLELEETTLDGLNTAMDRMRELMLQASNGTLADADRIAISSELKELVNYSAGLMNTRDAKGEYLFSGSKGKTQTYVLNGNRYEYQGDASNRSIQVASAQYVRSTDSGRRLFESIAEDPSMMAVGALAGSLENLNVEDPDAFTRFMRDNGDLSVEVNRVSGAPADYRYTIRNGAGTLITEGAYDGSTKPLVELDGFSFELNLPVDPSFPTASPSMKATGSLRNTLTSVNVTGSDQYTQLMRDEEHLELAVEYDDVAGNFTYSVVGANTGITHASGTYTSGTTMPLTLNLSGVDLTVQLPVDTAGEYPSSANLYYDAPNSAELTLRYDQAQGNILNTMLDTIDALRNLSSSNPEQRIALNERMAKTLTQITTAQERINESTASLGSRMNSLDNAEFSNTDFMLMTQGTLSAVEDLDYAAAATELAKRQLALEAAYASFAKIQNLSLFNYLN